MPQPAATHCPFDYLGPAGSATSGQRHPLVQATRRLRVPKDKPQQFHRIYVFAEQVLLQQLVCAGHGAGACGSAVRRGGRSPAPRTQETSCRGLQADGERGRGEGSAGQARPGLESQARLPGGRANYAETSMLSESLSFKRRGRSEGEGVAA